jgi:hypothetical protein
MTAYTPKKIEYRTISNPTWTKVSNETKKTLFAFVKRQKKHGTKITANTVEIYRTILFSLHGKTGYCAPSLQTIADISKVCRSTAKNALRVLEQIGALRRIRRFATWLVDGATCRVETSMGILLPFAPPEHEENEPFGGGVKSAPNNNINMLGDDSLRAGLRRQAKVAIDIWKRGMATYDCDYENTQRQIRLLLQ